MKRFSLGLLCLFCVNVYAEKGMFVRDAVGVKTYPAAPRLAQQMGMAPASILPPAETAVPEKIQELRDWNASGREPAHIGFMRPLPDRIDVRVSGPVAAKSGAVPLGRGVAAMSDHGTIIWSTMVKVEGAQRIRLHLENVSLPADAVLWDYGTAGTPTGFGRELIDSNHNLWAPAVNGDVAYLDVEVPLPSLRLAPVSFSIREVAQIFGIAAASLKPEDSPTCLVDSTCITSSTFPSITQARAAIAHIEWPESSTTIGLCSGGLLNNTNNDSTPYFLTANHCFSDQNTATSAEFFFDFQTSSCGGSFNLQTAPHSTGSQLLATSPTSDFTFLKLNSIPAGRYLLGWDPRSSSIQAGVSLYRVSHPVPADTIFPQMFSSTSVDALTGTCTGRDRPNFIYSDYGQGGTYPGSSGSPDMLAGGYVVGQLLGACGPNPTAGCDSTNFIVDGAFSVTYPNIQQWLSPGSGGQPTVCTPSSTTLCLSSSRFAVSAAWRTSDGNSGNGTAVALSADTGYFWFFNSSNVEMVLKVLNGCGVNSHYWVFAGGLTNVNVTMTVVDTKSGTVKTYTNPLNTAFVPIQDTSAFSTCP